jgi:hypothetical protein
VVLCPGLVPFVDHRFDCCDLLLRSVIHNGAYKVSATIEDQAWPENVMSEARTAALAGERLAQVDQVEPF